jgi:hypothetical protein
MVKDPKAEPDVDSAEIRRLSTLSELSTVSVELSTVSVDSEAGLAVEIGDQVADMSVRRGYAYAVLSLAHSHGNGPRRLPARASVATLQALGRAKRANAAIPGRLEGSSSEQTVAERIPALSLSPSLTSSAEDVDDALAHTAYPT